MAMCLAAFGGTPGITGSPASHPAPASQPASHPASPALVAQPKQPVPGAEPAREQRHKPPAKTPRATTRPPGTAEVSALASNGIPAVALTAYRNAASQLARTRPYCGIQWWLLAAIGRVESDHGRFAGAVLHTDGTTTPHIVGIALNGAGTAYIPAPANGAALAGDARYAHALGPMQFIPSTWDTYAADGNGDGIFDVFNIFDSALGAANYLCAAGGDLRTLAGRTRAVLAYNHSTEYLTEVLSLANQYATGMFALVRPADVTPPALPPVNPGPPLAPAKRPASTATSSPTAQPSTPVSTSARPVPEDSPSERPTPAATPSDSPVSDSPTPTSPVTDSPDLSQTPTSTGAP